MFAKHEHYKKTSNCNLQVDKQMMVYCCFHDILSENHSTYSEVKKPASCRETISDNCTNTDHSKRNFQNHCADDTSVGKNDHAHLTQYLLIKQHQHRRIEFSYFVVQWHITA